MAIFNSARTCPASKLQTVPTATNDVPTRKRRTSPTPHLDAGQYRRLLACIDEAGGVATLDAISRALPRVTQPISAVFDLCDAGILNVDWKSALDADMAVWRVDA